MKKLLFIILLFTIILLLTCNTFKTRDLRVVQICGTKDFGLSKTREISEDSKAGRLLSRYREYETLLAEMQKEESTEELKKIVENTKQRMKTIQEGIQSSIERKGDDFYNRYEFGKAIENYLDAKSYLSTQSGGDKIFEGLDKKIRLSRETGEGYLENKVRGYVDQALLLNLEGNKGDAKKSLNIAKSEMDQSIFTVSKAIEAYNEASEILKVSKYEANADCVLALDGSSAKPYAIPGCQLQVTVPHGWKGELDNGFTLHIIRDKIDIIVDITTKTDIKEIQLDVIDNLKMFLKVSELKGSYPRARKSDNGVEIQIVPFFGGIESMDVDVILCPSGLGSVIFYSLSPLKYQRTARPHVIAFTDTAKSLKPAAPSK
jgi:hypothetical protein